MLRLAILDLRRWLAPTERRLRASYISELAEIPSALRLDMGLNDARLADFTEGQVRLAMASRREDDARRLLEALNRMATARGFPPLRWQNERRL